MTRLVDCSFRLPEKGKVEDLYALVNKVRDNYMKDVSPGASYELIAFPDIGLLRFRSPGRTPAGVAPRPFDPSLKLTNYYEPVVAGYLLEKGTKYG